MTWPKVLRSRVTRCPDVRLPKPHRDPEWPWTRHPGSSFCLDRRATCAVEQEDASLNLWRRVPRYPGRVAVLDRAQFLTNIKSSYSLPPTVNVRSPIRRNSRPPAPGLRYQPRRIRGHRPQCAFWFYAGGTAGPGISRLLKIVGGKATKTQVMKQNICQRWRNRLNSR